MQPTNNRQSKTQKAFTLIELLVVIAIVGILAGMVVVNMSGATESARAAKGKAFSGSVRSVLLMNRVSEWKFDEGLGTNAADTVGANNGILFSALSPTWKSGADCVSGSCLSFDGVDDYVDCGSGESLKPTASLTLEVWVKPGAAQMQYAEIVSTHAFGYALEQDDVSNNLFHLSYYNGGTWQGNNIRTQLTTGQWQHLVVQKEGTAIRHFLNGTKSAEGAVLGNISYTAGVKLMIGRWASGGGRYFNGLIDEVRLYNAALPASRIREDYLAGLDKLLANGQITDQYYRQEMSKLNSTYATSE
jgi:prepilin-type N-terminal cleavage/methylation domain-containing protein